MKKPTQWHPYPSHPGFTPDEVIMSRIYEIRGKKVMLDKDLAAMYGVETKRLNEQVRRNADRFPEDFMFRLTPEEFLNLTSQIATSSWGGPRHLPYAFTEQGVSMLSGVLNSPVAIQVHIRIIRVFSKMRELLLTNQEIFAKLKKLEKEVQGNKAEIAIIFKALKQLLDPPPKQPGTRIGFRPND